MAESKESRELRRIFAEKGSNSEEFYECVRNFFCYLQHRYIGKRVPELDGDFWAAIQKSMSYYDAKRTNIVSWVHSVGRNVCSGYNYQSGKREKECADSLKDLRADEPSSFDVDRAFLDTDTMSFLLKKSCVRVKMSPQAAGDRFIRMSDNNPIKRHFVWEVLKLNLM